MSSAVRSELHPSSSREADERTKLGKKEEETLCLSGSTEISGFSELLVLIERYLSSGPCRKAAAVLRREIEENRVRLCYFHFRFSQ